MGAEIDRLEVQVEAQATKANNALDKLVGNLEKLEASLSHINASGLSGLSNGISKFASASAQLSGIDSRKFDTIAKNIEKLSTFNTQQIYSAASAMGTLAKSINSMGGVSANSLQVAQVAKDISKLGNKNVQVAITSLPQLAVALKKFMTTVSSAPIVSRNIIQMTDALASLAAQGTKVGVVNKSLTKSTNSVGNAMAVNTKKAFSLSSAIGKLYQSYYWVMRAGNGLWNSVESTSDYIEAYNYFDVTLGKIGSEWAHQWENYADKIGVSSAEKYANSFQTRLSENLGKLSGVQINIGADGSGLLTETGMKNLSLNIQEVTQHASQLASVTNSVGQTGEVSLAAANAFTKLGADMSSLFNVDYSAIMANLQSGLIGQSRALYKYGIDITNATLQTYAYELELGKAVSEMTQAEKMQLRMIAILDQSKVSWGDLANTINSPSNMIRQFTNNLKETGMVLGQLFVPALQRVLPVINGITIAIKRLLVNVAGLLGIKLDLSSFGQGFNSLEDSMDEVASGFDNATSAAKKFKTITLGIDELNINAPQDDAGGIGGSVGGIDLTDEILAATEEYEKAWQEAFDNMESRTQAFADKIKKIFKPITDPLSMMLTHLKLGGWSQAGEYFSDAAVELLKMLRKAISAVDWGEVGEDIGKFLRNVDWAKVITEGVKLKVDIAMALADVWFGSLEEAPFETVLLTTFGAMKFTKLGSLVAGKIGTAISSALVSMGGISGLMTTDIATIVGAGTATEIGVMFGTAVIGGIGATFAGFEFGKVIGQWINPEDELWYENFSWFGDDGFFETISEDWGCAFDGLIAMANDFENNPAIASLTRVLGGPFVNLIADFDKVKKVNDDLRSSIISVFSEITSFISEKGLEAGLAIGEHIAPWFTKEKWYELWNNVKSAVGEKWEEFSEWWNKSTLVVWWKEDVKPWFELEKWKTMLNSIKDSFSTKWSETSVKWKSDIKKWWEEDVTPWFKLDTWLEAMSGIKDAFSDIFKNAANTAIGIMNNLVDKINEIMTFDWDWTNPITGASWSGSVTLIELPKIPTFQTGGFPEDGLFMANHNELVGRFSNGRTAVANNEQIVEGIEYGVERAVARVLEPYLADIAQNTRETADKDLSVNIGDRDIARANARGSKSLGYVLVT